jgi:hypothetical protein
MAPVRRPPPASRWFSRLVGRKFVRSAGIFSEAAAWAAAGVRLGARWGRPELTCKSSLNRVERFRNFRTHHHERQPARPHLQARPSFPPRGPRPPRRRRVRGAGGGGVRGRHFASGCAGRRGQLARWHPRRREHAEPDCGAGNRIGRCLGVLARHAGRHGKIDTPWQPIRFRTIRRRWLPAAQIGCCRPAAGTRHAVDVAGSRTRYATRFGTLRHRWRPAAQSGDDQPASGIRQAPSWRRFARLKTISGPATSTPAIAG